MNSIAGVFKMHSRNSLVWFFVPWFVLLISLAVNLIIGLLLAGKSAVYTGGLSSIYVFMFIEGIVSLRDTFPFAIGFSVRRIDYVLGTFLMLLVSGLVTALLLLLLALIEGNVIINWGVNVHFFHLPYLNDGSPIEQFWVYFVPLVHLYLLGFIVGCVYRRFGGTGLWIFLGVAFLLITTFIFLGAYLSWWGELFAWLRQYTAFEIACGLVPPTLIYALVSFALLRKATI